MRFTFTLFLFSNFIFSQDVITDWSNFKSENWNFNYEKDSINNFLGTIAFKSQPHNLRIEYKVYKVGLESNIIFYNSSLTSSFLASILFGQSPFQFDNKFLHKDKFYILHMSDRLFLKNILIGDLYNEIEAYIK